MFLCDMFCLRGDYDSAATLYTHIFVGGYGRYSHQFDCLDEAVAEFTGKCLGELVDRVTDADDADDANADQQEIIKHVILETLPRISIAVAEN
jgi:hypothetical protein